MSEEKGDKGRKRVSLLTVTNRDKKQARGQSFLDELEELKHATSRSNVMIHSFFEHEEFP